MCLADHSENSNLINDQQKSLSAYRSHDIQVDGGIIAQDGVGVVDRCAVVRARVVRAECLAARPFLALAVVKLHVMDVVDRSLPAGSTDRVAAHFLVLSGGGIKTGGNEG